jgi:hypothetical protein
MVVVGKTDQFEHLYKEKFRSFAAQFGQFVSYERDIATRDIGLHLTKPLKTGDAQVTSCLCWFQLKGIMAKTLPKEKARTASFFKHRLEVEHLRFWFRLPMPTYLALYIESLDRFFILNLQRYVEEKWGRNILSLAQKTIDVEVPAASVLDRDALDLILRQSTVEEWIKALSADESQIKLCERDYKILWGIGTAAERKVEHRFEVFDWQSKTRGEVHIQERAKVDDAEWTTIRNHWQYMLSMDGVEDMYPYLDFAASEEGEALAEDEYEEEEDRISQIFGIFSHDDDDYRPRFTLKSGQVALGDDCAGEYHLYYLIPELNDLGRALFALIKTLIDIKFIELDDDPGEFMSVAPWHARKV